MLSSRFDSLRRQWGAGEEFKLLNFYRL
jgi:hypothetical protein